MPRRLSSHNVFCYSRSLAFNDRNQILEKPMTSRPEPSPLSFDLMVSAVPLDHRGAVVCMNCGYRTRALNHTTERIRRRGGHMSSILTTPIPSTRFARAHLVPIDSAASLCHKMLVRGRVLVYLATQSFNIGLCSRTIVGQNTGRKSRAREENRRLRCRSEMKRKKGQDIPRYYKTRLRINNLLIGWELRQESIGVQ